MSIVLVLSTAGSREEADRIARALVEERLAACVNILDGARSVYRWRDAVETSAEALLVIKTQSSSLDALRARIDALHSYELPEFVVLDVSGGSPAYLEWIAASTGGHLS